MNFDIEDIGAVRTSTHRLILGTRDDGKEVGFVLRGVGSDEYNAAERAVQIINIKEATLREVPLDMATDEGAGEVADGAIERKMVLATHCVIAWFGFTLKGEDLPEGKPDPEVLRNMLVRRPNWLNKIAGVVEDEAAFTNG